MAITTRTRAVTPADALRLLWQRARALVRGRLERTSTCTRPLLAPHVQLCFDARRGEHQLVGPDARLVLNGPGAAIALLCDGRTLEELCTALGERYVGVDAHEVAAFVRLLLRRRWLRDAGSALVETPELVRA